jgi:hypothetical protein
VVCADGCDGGFYIGCHIHNFKARAVFPEQVGKKSTALSFVFYDDYALHTARSVFQ